ncbi:MAG: hypothetical protein CL607_00190 [Anaerolineaceae bacterium]|nr:hypothetical protein [Anaerolineaceae bacterium]
MAMEPVKRKWTVQEYLDYEQETGIKHEYIDGEIYAMSGGTDRHSTIAVNCMAHLANELRDSQCRVHSSDMRVKINDLKYVYPDFSVVCGRAEFADEGRTMLRNPTLVAEVMSPSSKGYDSNAKAHDYRSLESVQLYMLIDQDRTHVQLYSRREGEWLFTEYTKLSDVVPLDALGCTLPLSEIYRNVDVEVDA